MFAVPYTFVSQYFPKVMYNRKESLGGVLDAEVVTS